MDDPHERFMWEAMKMARTGLEKGELPIGAVVVLNHFREYIARHSSGARWEWARTIAAL